MKIYTSNEKLKWFIPDEETVCVHDTTLNLDGNTYQEWDGFGGCFNELSQIALLTLTQIERKQIYDNLFGKTADGLRFDFCRIPIGASDYAEIWYSHNETENDYEMQNFSIERDKKYLLPYIKEALKRNPDMKFFASPWSPPAWMKEPKVYNFGRLVWTEKNLKAYALYLLKFIQAYEAEGVHISQLHVQNEVTSDQKFPSSLWSGVQLVEFIGKYLGPLFEENNINTEIWLGTINATGIVECQGSSRYNQYANTVLDDASAYKYIKGVSYQWEGKYALQVTHDSYPELKYIQSENECGDGRNSWEYAKYVFELFRHYITNGVCGYVYWNMVLAPEGSSTWGWKQNSMITAEGIAHYNHEYYIMKHFSRFVVPGAKRVGLKGHLAGNAVAFRNPDNELVLIVQNPFPYSKTFDFNGDKITLQPDTINTIVFD